MKVISPSWRTWMLLVFWLTSPCYCGVIGCAVGGRSVSIDSNSRVPFFGLELQERKRKSSGPPAHSIRSDNKTDVRIEPLNLTKGLGPLAKLGEKWDRKPSPLPPIAVPLTDTPSSRRPADDQAAVQIDFR